MTFYVKADDGSLVPGRFVLDLNGQPVTDPNKDVAATTPIFDGNGNQIKDANPDGYLIGPIDYSVASGVAFGQSVNNARTSAGTGTALFMMYDAFHYGSQDLQRSYTDHYGNNVVGGSAVNAFKDASSYNLGVATAVSGLPLIAAEIGGGFTALFSKNNNRSGAFFNDPNNIRSMERGYYDLNGNNSNAVDVQGNYTDPNSGSTLGITTNADGSTNVTVSLPTDTNPSANVTTSAQATYRADGTFNNSQTNYQDGSSTQIAASPDESQITTALEYLNNPTVSVITQTNVDGTQTYSFADGTKVITPEASDGNLGYAGGGIWNTLVTVNSEEQLQINTNVGNSPNPSSMLPAITIEAPNSDDHSSIEVPNGSNFAANQDGSFLIAMSNANFVVPSDVNVIVAGNSNVINEQSGANLTLTGYNNSVSGSNAVVSFTSDSSGSVFGSNNGIYLTAGDSANIEGGGNIVDTTAGASAVIGDTNGNADTVNANGDQFGGQAANGNGTGIWVNGNSEVQVEGSNNGIYLTAGDSANIEGGGNIVDTTAGASAVIGDTNGNADTVNANGDQFGGQAANGNGTGIWVNGNSEVQVEGSNNGIYLTAGDSANIEGGGNIVDTTAGASAVIGDTNGNADTVNANGDQFGGQAANGNGTGIWVNGNSEVQVEGSNNGIYLTAGDSANIEGGGNIVDTTAGASAVIGDTNGNADTVNANGDQFGGQAANGNGTGIWVNGNSEVQVEGSNNGIYLTAGDSANIEGGGNIVDTTAGASAVIGDTNGNADVINNDNSGSYVNIEGGTTADVNGSGGVVNIVGDNSSISASNATFNTLSNITGATITGSGDTVNLGANVSSSIVGSSNTINAYNGYDNINIDGSNNNFYGNNDGVNIEGDQTNISLAGDVNSYFWNGVYQGGTDGDGIYDGADDTGDDFGSDDDGDFDPLILNLHGNPIQTKSVEHSSAFFDTQNNGQRVQTGWGTAGEAYLVNASSDQSSVNSAADLVPSFFALNAMDTNQDGVLNSDDTSWNNLRVWVDTSGTATFESGSLRSLGEMGIASIDLNSTADRHDDNGNLILANSHFTWLDGSTGDIADVAFRYGMTDAQQAVPATIANTAVTTQAAQLVSAMSSFAVSSSADTLLSSPAVSSEAVLAADATVNQRQNLAA